MTRATKDELRALAAQALAAQGADETLDRDVALATGWRHEIPHGTEPHGYLVPPNGGGWVLRAPAFTASLDAALTLVPKDWAVGLEQALSGTPWHADVRSNGVVSAVAATPALALTAAALRARAEELTDDR